MDYVIVRCGAGQGVQGSRPPALVRDTREIDANPRRKFNIDPLPPIKHHR